MKRRELSRFFGMFTAVIGILMMIYGIYRGEMVVVLQKVVNICLECIGIG